MRELSTVHVEALPGDGARQIAGEEEDGVGDVIGFRDSPQHVTLDDLGLDLLGGNARLRGLHHRESAPRRAFELGRGDVT